MNQCTICNKEYEKSAYGYVCSKRCYWIINPSQKIKHREYMRTYQKEHYKKPETPEEIERYRQYHREYLREYRKNNPDKMRKYQQTYYYKTKEIK